MILFLSPEVFAKTQFTWGVRDDLVYFKRSAENFKSEIEQITKGEVKIQIVNYPEQAEVGVKVTDWIANNKFSISQELVGKLDQQHPHLQLWSLPFLFNDDAHVEKYIETAGQSALEKMENTELLPVDYSFSGGFLGIIGKKMDSFKELVKKDLTIEEDFDTFNGAISRLGIKVQRERNITDPYSEYILAVADEIASSDKVNTYYVNLTDHRVISRVVFVNKSVFNQVPEKYKAVFIETLKKHLKKEREYSVEGKNIVLSLLKNRGVKVNAWSSEKRKSEKAFFKQEYKKFEAAFPGVVEAVDKLK